MQPEPTRSAESVRVCDRCGCVLDGEGYHSYPCSALMDTPYDRSAEDDRMSNDGWFVQYRVRDRVTTQWEFSLDGLTEEQAVELDQRIRAVVEAFEAELFDG